MKLITLLFATLLLINCQKKLLCEDFKTGKFELIREAKNRKYIIIRTKDSQIEQTFDLTTNKKLRKDSYYKISWVSDCEYVLMHDLSKTKDEKRDIYINSTGGYICDLKNVKDNCATVEGKRGITVKICKID